MPQQPPREHFIPLTLPDLVGILRDPLRTGESDQFGQFAQILTAIFHYEYHNHLQKLTASYTGFDPDRDTMMVDRPTGPDRDRKLDELFREFTWLMERANYVHLSPEDLRKALSKASDWGVNMDVDWNCFDRLEIFVRGDAITKRTRRRLNNFYRQEEVSVPIYQRLVLILKQRKHKRLGPDADTDNVFLKIFKDVPKVDLEMLLPGTQVVMPKREQGKLGVSLASTVGFVGYKLATTLSLVALPTLVTNPLALWGPVSLVAGYGYRTYSGYQQTKTEYSLKLTRSLYYQSLDSNAGVLCRLLHEAEVQECREALLAYYFLWRHAGANGWTESRLDAQVESFLEKQFSLRIDFEVDDALGKLSRLGILEQTSGSYRVLPIKAALRKLDHAWDNIFPYANEPEKAAA